MRTRRVDDFSMGLCWRSSPLVALMLIVGHVTSWFGIAPAKAVASTSTAVGSVPGVSGLLSGAGSVVGQIFVWLFVLVVLQILFSLLGAVRAEIRLRRMYDRPTGGRWGRVVGGDLRRPPGEDPSHSL
ncbi:MAG TPA: hypothetical protein VL595_16225 [Pseudonocardia sp.]|nr:hypothetical protein [Pseudonocardia sp.]